AYNRQIAQGLDQRRPRRRRAASSESGEKDSSNRVTIGLQYFECCLKAREIACDVGDCLSKTGSWREGNHPTFPEEYSLGGPTVHRDDVRYDYVAHEVFRNGRGCDARIGRKLREIGDVLVVLDIVLEVDLQDGRWR